MPRTQWIHRFDTMIAAQPTKPGIWRRKEGGFVIRARVRDPRTGKDREIRRILPDGTLDQAVAQLLEEKSRIAKADAPPCVPKVRLRDYAPALLAKKIQIGQIRSAASRNKWRLTLQNHIVPRLGNLYMSEMRRTDLIDYHETLAGQITQGLWSPHTCDNIMKVVKVIVRAFTREYGLPDIVSDIPGFDHSLRRTYTRQQPNSLRPHETEEFLSAVAELYPDYLTIICLGFALGLRPSSLRALYKEDILFDDGGWLLNRRSHTVGQEIMERTKTGKDTEIPLSAELLEMLRRHIDNLPPGPMRESPLLFPKVDGGVLSKETLWGIFGRLQRRLNLTKKITPRGMRRTSKDLFRLSGTSQVVTMAINGHETDKMHHHYSTVNEVEIRTALSRATELAGLRRAVQIGGKIGVTAVPSAGKNPRQRRDRPMRTSLSEDSGRFSSSHGMGSFARRLAGRVGAVGGGRDSARAGRSDARQEALVVAVG